MSPSPERAVRVDVLRAAVVEAVRRSSLRSVAADVGMSHRGLGKFINESPPREATVRKLTDWYLREAAGGWIVSREAVAAALVVLLAGIPERDRAAAARQVLATIRKVHADAGVPVPAELAAE